MSAPQRNGQRTTTDDFPIEGKRVRARYGDNIQKSSVSSVSSVPDLAALAARVSRLCPSHRDPERFHADKSEIVAELRRLAREADRG